MRKIYVLSSHWVGAFLLVQQLTSWSSTFLWPRMSCVPTQWVIDKPFHKLAFRETFLNRFYKKSYKPTEYHPCLNQSFLEGITTFFQYSFYLHVRWFGLPTTFWMIGCSNLVFDPILCHYILNNLLQKWVPLSLTIGLGVPCLKKYVFD